HLSAYEPFSELFQHGKIIVHQCGIGTTAQALLSGRPQILVPFSHDQPDNAQIVAKKGIGNVIKVKDLSEEALVKAIQSITKNINFAKNAQDFSNKMDKKSFEERLLRAVEKYV
ncbi:MAG: glycosyltransferase, partial [Candidatus Sericytochromatia bacterium]